MEHHPESSDAAGEEHGIPSLPVRIVQVFVSPAKLFDALRHRPAWIGALLGLVLIGVAMQLLTPVILSEEAWREVIETQMAGSAAAGADRTAVEQQIEFLLTWGPTIGAATMVVITPISLCVIAGLLLIAFNVILGGAATFKQLLSASVHASYVHLAGALIVLALMAMGAQQTTLSPSLLLPEMEGFIGRFLNGINVFSVWTCGVLGIAVSRLYRGRSIWAGTMYLLALYVLMVAGLAALGGLAG